MVPRSALQARSSLTRIAVVIALLIALGVAESPGVRAQSGAGAATTTAVEVTVWRSISDPAQLYVSTRPAGGRWRTLNTPLDLSMRSASGRFHQSNAVRVAVPLGRGVTATVEVTVWRSVADPALLYISTRPAGGRWRTLDTPLDLSMRSASGRFHQSSAVRVAVPVPDLVIDPPTVSASRLMPGQTFALSVTVRNRGTGAAGDATLIYYRSDDATITAGDTEVGRDRVAGLAASSGASEKSLRTQAPAAPGVYYYGACVTAVAGEADPTNNCSVNAVRVEVQAPDLVVDPPTVSASHPMAGQAFALSITVRNRGTGTAGPATLTYYRSDDATITTDDTEVGRDWVAALDTVPGTSEESTRTQAPTTPGAYYYGACVAAVTGEANTTNNCSAAVAVPVAAFNLQQVSWVADGLTSEERRALGRIRYLAQVDLSMSSQRVAGASWLADGVTADDLGIINNLESLAGSHAAIAAQLATVPDRTGHLIGDALRSVLWILSIDPDRSEHLQQQAWFRDGLTEEEAALIVVLRSASDTEDVFQDLLRGGQVQSETITLPLAGAVDLYAVGRSSLALAGQLERMRFAAASLEAFLETPWPKSATIALVELESDLGSDFGGWNSGHSVVVKHLSKGVTYHELAHFYFGAATGVRTPVWLSEGAAEFLELHTLRLTGDIGSVRALYAGDRVRIAEECAPQGWATVQGWNETGEWFHICPYWLGRQFLAGMERTLGQAVVVAALRELFETGRGTARTTTEDEIYQAFLTNTPPSQREAFRLWYSCLHGRPIPGYTTPPPRPPVAPQSRDALAALYHATNGPGWQSSEHWLSDAPVDQWHGVGVDCDGSVIALDLTENQLSGPIPPELGRLTKLTGLSLADNQLSEPIPPALGRLTHLTALDLSKNQLTGPIPLALGRLANLEDLRLSSNQLTGPIPPALGRLANLEDIRLSSNQLTGPIPPDLGRLTKLTGLGLADNQLSGPIPPVLGGLANLRWLYVERNLLTGQIPAELGGLSKLDSLDLSGNQLSGPIPPALGRLAHLTNLDLWDNQLSGPIPPVLGDLANLTGLYLSGNQLSGPIPPALGRLATLTRLSLWGNQLSGPIPPALGRLAHLEYLYLNENQLNGPIPPALGGLAHLTALSLWDNQLSGPIPPALGRLAHLTNLNLGRNRLSGPIPPALSGLANLTYLNLGGNQLNGPIPPELGRLAHLEYLYLFGNQLTGCVPQGLMAAEDDDIDHLGLAICEDS
ncbi:MAG: hypothetical protein OXG19_09445 [Chloroflexi bacterium]|nr:hypothetical protein [Chloroflexota bacterium]